MVLRPNLDRTGGSTVDLAGSNAILAPGSLVRHPGRPDWGAGQVQSSIGGRITVNFEEVGKVVIDGFKIALVPVFDE